MDVWNIRGRASDGNQMAIILIIISSDFREGNTNLLYTGLMVTMVKIIAGAHRDLCVMTVLLCCIMQSIFYAN